jgi:uncharacterized protein YjaZ
MYNSSDKLPSIDPRNPKLIEADRKYLEKNITKYLVDYAGWTKVEVQELFFQMGNLEIGVSSIERIIQANFRGKRGKEYGDKLRVWLNEMNEYLRKDFRRWLKAQSI